MLQTTRQAAGPRVRSIASSMFVNAALSGAGAKPGKGHLLGVQQIIETLLHNIQLDVALLQLLQQIGYLGSLQYKPHKQHANRCHMVLLVTANIVKIIALICNRSYE